MKYSECFVCKKSYPDEEMSKNMELLLPVCLACKGTEVEKKCVEEYLDSLAEGFVCGCI